MLAANAPLSPHLEEALKEIIKKYSNSPLLPFAKPAFYNEADVKDDIETAWAMLSLTIDKPTLEIAVFNFVATFFVESYYKGNNRLTDFAQFITLREYIRELIKLFEL